MVDMSNKIREFRFKNNQITQKQLAERVGVSRQTLNAIENSRRAPTIDVAIRIANVFRVPVEQLFALDYEGRPARRKRAATIAVERPQASFQRSTEVETGREPTAKEPEKEITLASLRRLIQ